MNDLVRCSGQVVDAVGRPVPHAFVTVTAGPEPMPEIALVADGAGRFAIGLPPGRWTLRAHGEAGSGTADVDATPAGCGELQIAIAPDGP